MSHADKSLRVPGEPVQATTTPKSLRTSRKALEHGWEVSRWMVAPLTIAFSVRALVFLVADVGGRLVAQMLFPGALLMWLRKDGNWYVAIARDGYGAGRDGLLSINFFPLYPLTVRLVEMVTRHASPHESYVVAGLVVSWLAFASACVFVYRLALDRFGSTTAYGSVLLLATFPFGLYFGAIYSESLFLALAVAAFLGIERRLWWLAAIAAALAGAVRPPGLIVGVCVVLAYALDWLQTHHPPRRDTLALALTPLGTAAYLLYCWLRFGDPLAYVRASQSGWQGAHLQLDGLKTVARLLTHPGPVLHTGKFDVIVQTVSLALLFAFIAALVPVARLLGPPYLVYTLASFILPLLTFSTPQSLGRYLSVSFPVFLVAGYLVRDRPQARDLLCIAGATFLGLFTTLFVAGYGLS